MFKNVGWTLGNDCPCKCNHCYSLQVREKGMNITKEMVDIVFDQLKKVGTETINLGGNEPLYTNGLDASKSMLPYIIQKAKSNNILIGLTSAGPTIIGMERLYNDEFKLINDIDISIDSPIKEEHNENRGAPIFDLAIKSLEICQKYGIPHTLVMCAMKWNFTKDRIQGLIDLSKKYGANIRINLLKPTEEKHLDMMPTKKQVIEGYNYLIQNCDTINMTDPVLSASYGNNNAEPGCYCGLSSLRINSVTPTGEISISPCVYMHHYKVGNLLKDDILDIVNSEQFKAFNKRKEDYNNIEQCKNCDKIDLCRGGCASSAYWYNYYSTGEKTMYAKDPYCFYDGKDKPLSLSLKKEKNYNMVHENYLCTWIGKGK